MTTMLQTQIEQQFSQLQQATNEMKSHLAQLNELVNEETQRQVRLNQQEEQIAQMGETHQGLEAALQNIESKKEEINSLIQRIETQLTSFEEHRVSILNDVKAQVSNHVNLVNENMSNVKENLIQHAANQSAFEKTAFAQLSVLQSTAAGQGVSIQHNEKNQSVLSEAQKGLNLRINISIFLGFLAIILSTVSLLR
jgi:dihydroorotate dehydrogenase